MRLITGFLSAAKVPAKNIYDGIYKIKAANVLTGRLSGISKSSKDHFFFLVAFFFLVDFFFAFFFAIVTPPCKKVMVNKRSKS